MAPHLFHQRSSQQRTVQCFGDGSICQGEENWSYKAVKKRSALVGGPDRILTAQKIPRPSRLVKRGQNELKE